MATHYTTCSLCEALCGLEITTEGDRVIGIRGDADDPFSQGHICPKAPALAGLHHDPDRLRRPRIREGDRWREVSWKAALAFAGEGLGRIQKAHGRDAVGLYFGNPTGHDYQALVGVVLLQKLLGTKNVYSANSVDGLPRIMTSARLFDSPVRLPVPDIDRTDFMLVLGANPVVSNGSIMSAPGVRRRLKALRARGGRLVVIDPRRTETAAIADTHHFIRPGTDPLLLASLIRTILAEGLDRTTLPVEGLDAVRRRLASFTPARVAGAVGIAADAIEALARGFATSRTAVCYGRMGTCTQGFGALCCWLIDLLNLITGNLDAEGGAMFPRPAADLAALAARLGVTGEGGRWHSRVGGHAEFNGELPVAALAEEMLTPGPGQLRGMVIHAGNPVLSLPDGRRIEEALGGLEFMVAIDLYQNATTRLADVILPAPSPLQRDHYPLVFGAMTVRDVAKYCPPIFPLDDEQRSSWHILTALGQRIQAARSWRGKLLGLGTRAAGAALPPDRLLALLLRLGPHDVSLGALRAAPHGVDLGPLQPGVLAGQTLVVDLPDYLADVDRLDALLEGDAAPLLLIGRRTLRSNNSWMHNVPKLVAGAPRCTLLMHPIDAEARALAAGDAALLQGPAGQIEVPVELSDDVMPGVVSLPHGWGHDRPGSGLSVASAQPGASINDVIDAETVDPISGTARLNAVPVQVVRA